jgi:hypothetical protein
MGIPIILLPLHVENGKSKAHVSMHSALLALSSVGWRLVRTPFDDALVVCATDDILQSEP